MHVPGRVETWIEIDDQLSQAVLSYVRLLRELALEGVHGNRADASRLGAPASGRALEMMNQSSVVGYYGRIT